jgi:hypothetical protein
MEKTDFRQFYRVRARKYSGGAQFYAVAGKAYALAKAKGLGDEKSPQIGCCRTSGTSNYYQSKAEEIPR